jgi:hypothetical protein
MKSLIPKVAGRVRSCLAACPRTAVALLTAVVLLTFGALAASVPAGALAAPARVAAVPPPAAAAQPSGGPSLESAASRAGSLGRNVAMSLIGLGFAMAAIRLVFRRSFKEAAGIFVVGLLAILLATPAGINVLHSTVNTLFGGA